MTARFRLILAILLIFNHGNRISAYFSGRRLPLLALKTRSVFNHLSATSSDAPLGLDCDSIAARWNVIKFGQDGQNGIELLDKSLASKIVKIQLSRVGGLGLDLVEYNVGKGDIGLVLVGDILPDSNAAACKQFQIGDALQSVSTVPKEGEEPVVTRLEGLNFDSTVAALGEYSDYKEVVITVKRVIKRGEVLVQMVGPQGAYRQ
jgi:hypothetical protein